MWSGLRELFGGLSERGRFWLAVVIIWPAGRVCHDGGDGVDLTPLWAMLGG